MMDDGGIATCLKAKSGEQVWNERVGGNYSAAPMIAGERVYFFSEDGRAFVLQAGPAFKVLATNTLGDGFMATPAVIGNSLILRSRTQLYRIDNQTK
jgi:outer membrane protein assembly factor BamB